MKIERYIYRLVGLGLVFLSPFTFHLSSLSAQDYTRLSERTLMGTARYVGMGGAMTAIGGDPSAVIDNVAGLGLYRRFETSLTLDHAGFIMAPQASIVLSFPTFQPSGVLYHNFMFSYKRAHSFSRTFDLQSANDRSLGALFATAEGDMGIPFCTDRTAANTLSLQERGYVNQYVFDWAMNISDRWYWGLGIHVHSFHFASEGDYTEVFSRRNTQGQPMSNRSKTAVIMDGAGCSLASGLVARPLSWLRLGLGIETPSLGTLTTITQGTFEAYTDSLRWSDAPNLRETVSSFHMPMHLSTSVAFQISRYALIAFQYDYRHMNLRPDQHSLRAGFEVVPIQGLYINGGYAYESSFRSQAQVVPIDPTLNRQDAYFQELKRQQFISCGIGYRGRYVIAQAAYQYRLQRLDISAHEQATPYTLNPVTHRVIFTLAWHGN